MNRLLLFLATFIACGLPSFGAVLNSNGSDTDTAAKWNSAVDGDIVLLPSGSFTWTVPMVAAGKAVKIMGSGGGWAKGSSRTSVTVGTGAKTFTVQAGLGFVNGETISAVLKRSQATATMTGTVTSYSGTTLVINVTSVVGSGTWASWNFYQNGVTRITYAGNGTVISMTEDESGHAGIFNLDFRITGGGNAININGAASGLGQCIIVQSNRIEVLSVSSGKGIILTVNSGVISRNYFDTGFEWPVRSGATGPNTCQFLRMPTVTQTNWLITTPYGSLDTTGEAQIYVEDCWLFGAFSEGADFDGGVMLTFRYNYVDNTGLTSHGLDTGCYGLRWLECYNNSFLFDNYSSVSRTAPMNYFFFMRGGTGMFATNFVEDIDSSEYPGKVELKYMIENLRRSGGTFGCWNSGYPAPRQIGQGRVTGSGTTTGTTCGSAGAIGYLGDMETIYQWANTGSGVFNTPSLENFSTNQCGGGAPDVLTYIKAGQSYSNAPKPSWTMATYPNTNLFLGASGPAILSGSISNNGLSFTLAFSKIVTFGAGGNGGFTPTLSGGPATLTYTAGSGTTNLVYTSSRYVSNFEFGTLAYTQPGNGVEDAGGIDLQSFSALVLVNNNTTTTNNSPRNLRIHAP